MGARGRQPAVGAAASGGVKVRSATSVGLLERVRAICLAQPGATEKLSHGEPTWFASEARSAAPAARRPVGGRLGAGVHFLATSVEDGRHRPALRPPTDAEKTSEARSAAPAARRPGKVFAMFDDHHHGAAHVALWLPAALREQEALIASDPARYFRPPYVGVKGWVGVVIDTDPDWDRVEALIVDAWHEVVPRRVKASGPSP